MCYVAKPSCSRVLSVFHGGTCCECAGHAPHKVHTAMCGAHTRGILATKLIWHLGQGFGRKIKPQSALFTTLALLDP